MNPDNHPLIELRNVRYYTVAEAAAFAESRGQYEHAEKLWSQATKLARNIINVEWAEHRNHYCLSVIRNGWSYNYFPAKA
ncbi:MULTISPECIES: ANR family transcriptional regulator [Pantoea]|uniref:ANR family transcriptional regulator n=1 Tax=Pantoea TaxID=53335 RepID=UPI0005351694|nr:MULTISPECIES: ANR family transcriptional regulator [Pantoea]MCS3401350.1 ANR family transcriptional regulator [Pantoea sp. B566]